MSAATHTPGGWTFGWGSGLSGPTTPTLRPFCGGDKWRWTPVSKDGETIAICPEQDKGHPGNYEANARLIAAAPDLLALLQRYVDMDLATDKDRGNDLMQTSGLHRAAVALLAKATGAAA